MSGETTRRQVLKAATSTGSIAAFGAAGAAGSRPSVRVIEVGVAYEVPKRGDYDRFHLDSRPGYTVRGRTDEVVLTRRSGSEERFPLAEGGTLVDERRANEGRVAISGSGEVVEFLPTSLSARKRVKEAIALENAHELPAVTVHWNDGEVGVSVPSRGRIVLPPETARTITLEPETVDVRTEVVTDEVAAVDSVPDWQASLRREPGTATVDAVPTVEVVDHGELRVASDALG